MTVPGEEGEFVLLTARSAEQLAAWTTSATPQEVTDARHRLVIAMAPSGTCQ
ncbi:hypothetical protein [Micromonospora sp. DT227]|uniref:hypothetical protein n=1 Tax=Micromonospora sp. DT227 TaxID=3393433 RepID=UPI003CEE3BCE